MSVDSGLTTKLRSGAHRTVRCPDWSHENPVTAEIRRVEANLEGVESANAGSTILRFDPEAQLRLHLALFNLAIDSKLHQRPLCATV
jgi:hypothetical protein